MNHTKMNQLVKEVGEWSKQNFGEQETLILPVVPFSTVKKYVEYSPLHIVTVDNPVVCLGSLAPLMGIVEEYGEFIDADTEDDRKDAMGDMVIYLSDYCNREGMEFPNINLERDAILGVEIGKLFHATLKRFQGIRGFDDTAKYIEFRDKAVEGIVTSLARIDDQFWFYGIDTWNKIVKKRNWTKQAAEASNAKIRYTCLKCQSSNLYQSSMNVNHLICRQCGSIIAKDS